MSRSRQLQACTVLGRRTFCSTPSSSSSITNGDKSIYNGLFGELKHIDEKDSLRQLHNDKSVQIRRGKHQAHKFIDSVRIEVTGGRGGNGCISFETLSPGKKRPSGGNGGRGGNVYLMGDEGAYSLNFETFHFNGGDGGNGGGNKRTGKNGKDIILKVPCGTVISEVFTDEEREFLGEMGYDDSDNDLDLDDDVDDDDDDDNSKDEENRNILGFQPISIDRHGQQVLVVEGGKPGLGNAKYAGTKTRRAMAVPGVYVPGQRGPQRSLHLELKMIADVGLVGYPNAGKSTLLAALSNATPKIAPYAFTTLHPNIGVVQYSDGVGVTLADIPGLIDGAHENRGLGHEFLKHIERTKTILYVLDGAGTEDRQPHKDLESLIYELEKYDASLLKKPSFVFSNKDDLINDENSNLKSRLIEETQQRGLLLLSGSADTCEGIENLANQLRIFIEEERANFKVNE